jgi:DNA-directed RNA polymerase subunit RPC12/RpoP
MNIQTAFAPRSETDLARSRCPRCGSIVLMAERAAFNPDGRIRHSWSCDDCGHEFVTSMRMREHEPGRDIAS